MCILPGSRREARQCDDTSSRTRLPTTDTSECHKSAIKQGWLLSVSTAATLSLALTPALATRPDCFYMETLTQYVFNRLFLYGDLNTMRLYVDLTQYVFKILVSDFHPNIILKTRACWVWDSPGTETCVGRFQRLYDVLIVGFISTETCVWVSLEAVWRAFYRIHQYTEVCGVISEAVWRVDCRIYQ